MSEPIVAMPAWPPAAEAAAATDTEAAALASQAAAVLRERWLFRHATRDGQVHPLRCLLKRYRAGERQ
jgi:hypothetical protein